jgi:hypothetical protein
MIRHDVTVQAAIEWIAKAITFTQSLFQLDVLVKTATHPTIPEFFFPI